MEVVEDHPNGAPIQILRCRWCGTERSRRARWATRCHVCLDDRSSPELDVFGMARELLSRSGSTDWLTAVVRTFLQLGPRQEVPLRGVAEFISATTLMAELAAYERPGWTVIAGDVHGLPWTGTRWQTHSFGTWGRHEGCGRIQKMRRGRTECDTCPPEPDSRSHRARADDPYLLYLVRYGRFQKFGRGYPDRVRAHQRLGARPVQVLSARHEEVVAAELALKREFRHLSASSGVVDLPLSFGAGTEVLPAEVAVDLLAVLPEAEDVSHRYLPG